MKIVKHLKWSDKAWIEPLNLFQKPNPVNDHVYIEWSKWKNQSTLQIISVTGTQVSQHIIAGKSGIVDVSHLSSGMYFFVLQSDEEIRTFKIVKR